MILAAVTAERARERGGRARARARAGRAAPHRDAARERGPTPRASSARSCEEAARALGVASASLVRYESPGLVTVMGGWSETSSLLFPVGSQIELGTRGLRARRGLPHRRGAPRDVSRRRRACSPAACARTATARASPRRSRSPAGSGARSSPRRSTRRPLPVGSEQRLSDFADLVAQALANADAHDKLAASRARIVGAGDAERRRLERNLHDGAQQRLVSLALQLRLTQSALERRPDDVLGLLVEAQAELSRALDELRELARGIHPAILTDRGLGPGARGDHRARPAPGRAHGAARGPASPSRSRRPSTTSSPRRSRTSPSTPSAESATVSVRLVESTAPRRHHRRRHRRRRSRRAARACAASPTASRRSTAACASRARPGEGTRIEAQIPCR